MQLRRGRRNPRPVEQDENVARGEGRISPEVVDQPAVERDGRHHLAQVACAGDDIDREAGSEPRRGAHAQAAAAEDVEGRPADEDPLQAPAVTLRERALQRPGARELLRLRLRAIRLLRVERERGP